MFKAVLKSDRALRELRQLGHEIAEPGTISCYWPTFGKAAQWIAGWPDAVEAHITSEPHK